MLSPFWVSFPKLSYGGKNEQPDPGALSVYDAWGAARRVPGLGSRTAWCFGPAAGRSCRRRGGNGRAALLRGAIRAGDDEEVARTFYA